MEGGRPAGQVGEFGVSSEVHSRDIVSTPRRLHQSRGSAEQGSGAPRHAAAGRPTNAVKYGKAAHVSIGSAAQGIEIAIDDNGPGIPGGELVRALQPFSRIETSRNPETGGIGLGLAIALSVIQADGGDLRLLNRPEGGLRALVVLPGDVPLSGRSERSPEKNTRHDPIRRAHEANAAGSGKCRWNRSAPLTD